MDAARKNQKIVMKEREKLQFNSMISHLVPKTTTTTTMSSNSSGATNNTTANSVTATAAIIPTVHELISKLPAPDFLGSGKHKAAAHKPFIHMPHPTAAAAPAAITAAAAAAAATTRLVANATTTIKTTTPPLFCKNYAW